VGAVGSESVAILLSDKENECALVAAHQDAKSAVIMTMWLSDYGTTAGTGEYTAYDSSSNPYSGKVAEVILHKTDAACNETLDVEGIDATSGPVKLDSFVAQASGTAKGSINLVFGQSTDKFTGTFSAVYCTAWADELNSGNEPVYTCP